MNSESRARTLKRVMAVVATATLAAGCSSTEEKHASYRGYEPAPVVTMSSSKVGTEAAGGTGATYESQAGAATGSQATAAGGESSSTVIPLQREELQVGTQQVEAGGVRLRKVVTTETVNQPIQLRKESLVVDKMPANAAQGGTGAGVQSNTGGAGGTNNLSTPFQEGEMTVTLRQEQPMIQKQIVPAGTVVVRKQVITQPSTVQQQVRRENIQAEKIGESPDIQISSNVGAGGTNEAVGAGPSAGGQAQGAGRSGVSDLSQLTSASDPTSFAGQQANIASAKVQQVSADGKMLTVAGPDGKTIHVRTSEPITGISQGDTVTVKGAVRPASAAGTLGLDEQTTQMLVSEKVYIDATTVSPAGQ